MSERSGNATDLVVITGLSGSGKTLAMRAMEDLAYYCVDNLPIELIPTFYDLCRTSGRDISKVALVADIRGGAAISALPQRIEEVRTQGQSVSVVFLDADDETLLRRFTESRRPHPLATEGPLPEVIAMERGILDPVREHADLVIDTSRINPHELRAFLFRHFQGGDREKLPRITVTTFGFKHGMPRTADLVWDVRFLPNPHFVEGLREKTGRDPEVQEFLEQHDLYREFQALLQKNMDFLLPAYESEGKSYLTIAIGCTGGKHRSVATALFLSDSLKESGFRVELRHRDISK